MTWTDRTPRAAIAAVLIAFTAACGGDDGGGPATPAGSILVAASPATLSVDQGTGAASTITLTRVAGFSGLRRSRSHALQGSAEVWFSP
jgi:hypothetical protein